MRAQRRYLAAAMAGWIVKFDGPCSRCGTVLRAGTEAVWDRRLRKMHCIECPTDARPHFSPAPLDVGVAGASARREHDRRQAKLHAARKDGWGNRLGGLINQFKDDPQSIRAWGLGARGEQKLGAALAQVPGLVTLNDRRISGTRGNIDHIVVGPAGVFVIDAKFYEDRMVRVVDRGSFFRSDLRLTVGGRDKSNLSDGMEWQVQAVTSALIAGGIDPVPPVTAVLCFVGATWPILTRPRSFSGVRLESERSIVKLLGEPVLLQPDAVDRIARALADALPLR
jgi:hypothetical protein